MQIFYEGRKVSVSLFSPQIKTILLRSSKEVELCVILPAPLTFKIELTVLKDLGHVFGKHCQG